MVSVVMLSAVMLNVVLLCYYAECMTAKIYKNTIDRLSKKHIKNIRMNI